MGDEDNKVSIITVCYNSVKTIENTIKSVIQQTYPDIEYIVIDGGSIDGTVDIIKKYQHHISCWISEPDQGIADAWNKGIARAGGAVVGIINADDYYVPEAAAIAAAALDANREYGFVFGDLAIIDAVGTRRYYLKGDPDYHLMIRKDMPSIPHPTVFMRREVYEKFGVFDLSYRSSIDYEFLLRIHLQGVKGLYVEQTLATMRLGGVSDANYAQSHRETARVSIQYGFNPILATTRRYFKVITSVTRHLLEALGLTVIVRLYRQLVGKPHRYDTEN